MDSVLSSLLITKWITVDSRDTALLSLVIIPLRSGYPVQQYKDPKASASGTAQNLRLFNGPKYELRFVLDLLRGVKMASIQLDRCGQKINRIELSWWIRQGKGWGTTDVRVQRESEWRVIENNLRCYSVFCSFRSLRRYISGAWVWIPSMKDTYEVVLTFESVDQILWCDHSNETSSAVLSHGTIYLVCSFNFWIPSQNPMVWPFKWNLFSSTFTCYYLFCM